MNLIKRHPLATALCVVLLAGIVLITWRVRVNQARKLDTERLQAQWKTWQKVGPRSYTLRYSILLGGSAKADEYEVQVIGGKPVAATFNGKEESPDRLHNYGMEKLFTFIERFLELDTKLPPEQVIERADFGHDGRLLWYYRYVPGKRESVEIEVQSVE